VLSVRLELSPSLKLPIYWEAVISGANVIVMPTLSKIANQTLLHACIAYAHSITISSKTEGRKRLATNNKLVFVCVAVACVKEQRLKREKEGEKEGKHIRNQV